MILIEQRACANRLDAERQERQYIEDLHATLNQVIPSRTRREWEEHNQEQIREYKRLWHTANKDRLSEQSHERYMEKREHTLQKVKDYYENNKEKVDQWRNARFECECGGSYFNHNKARHERTLKHQEYLGSTED